MQFVASTAVGGGDGLRIAVPPDATTTPKLVRTDTVRGGSFVFGPGAGLLYHFGPRVAYLAELRALASLGKLAAVVDLNTRAAARLLISVAGRGPG
jgi:hypothetical protein